jgi:hypothetical protein
MLRSACAITAVALTIGASHWQTAPTVVPTSADLVVWRDAFGDGMAQRFALVQETIRPDTLGNRLRRDLNSTHLTSEERALIEKLVQRNAAVVPLSSALAGSLGALLVDPTSIFQANGLDLDAIFRKSQQVGRKLAWLSLPAFSDDDQRAAVYMEWRGGFDDAGGEGTFMERRQGRWVRTRAFALWIT